MRFMCPNNLSLLIMATVSGECVGLNLLLIGSSVASYTLHTCRHRLILGVGLCVKGNFVDEQGNHTDLVEILCGRAVGGLTALMLTYVVVGWCSVRGIGG